MALCEERDRGAIMIFACHTPHFPGCLKKYYKLLGKSVIGSNIHDIEM